MIKIHEYNEVWPEWFYMEKDRVLKRVIGSDIEIEHVGSTSVYGMPSKPTIDMCMTVEILESTKNIIAALQTLDYQYLPELEKTIPDRRYLQFLDENGEHKFHIHIVERNSWRHQDYLLVRDYLREHSDEAEAYAQLKRDLSNEYTHDREAYTEGKAEFIRDLLGRARIWQSSQRTPIICR